MKRIKKDIIKVLGRVWCELELREKDKTITFELIKQRYDCGYLDKDQLKRWVLVNKEDPTVGISAEDFKKIAGEDYYD